ncbi:heterotrimeric G protein alpha subunit 4 [Mycena amicta]|nr:heterotrimeric G protein alpha subunit 4 [Mycena amicta]
MGACLSTPDGLDSTASVTDRDKQLHRLAEKELKEAKAKLALQVKVLLLGSGDSGKSTIVKQMRLIHSRPFNAQEKESFRQLVFDNLTRGLKYTLEALPSLDLEPPPDLGDDIALIDAATDLGDGEVFPQEYLGSLQRLLQYFFADLPRLFDPSYIPTEQDIVHTRARTIGITETTFKLREHEMLMVDVGGQKSERRKWIHCFQDVTSILFLVSLSGYDQCLVEDRDANQMQDAMTIWDSICHSQWFKQTSIILFLNKDDLFQNKIKTSPIRTFFPDFEGEAGNASAGREYFKKRFGRLAQKAGRTSERQREVYIHTTTATDTELLRVVMAAVEDSILNKNIRALLM